MPIPFNPNPYSNAKLLNVVYFQEKYGKIGVVHIDSHADTIEHQLDERLAHGTPFSRAVEEELLDAKRVIQIGLRGSLYSHDDFNVAEKQVLS